MAKRDDPVENVFRRDLPPREAPLDCGNSFPLWQTVEKLGMVALLLVLAEEQGARQGNPRSGLDLPEQRRTPAKTTQP